MFIAERAQSIINLGKSSLFDQKFVATESHLYKCDSKCATYVAPYIWLNDMIFLQLFIQSTPTTLLYLFIMRLSIDVCFAKI